MSLEEVGATTPPFSCRRESFIARVDCVGLEIAETHDALRRRLKEKDDTAVPATPDIRRLSQAMAAFESTMASRQPSPPPKPEPKKAAASRPAAKRSTTVRPPLRSRDANTVNKTTAAPDIPQELLDFKPALVKSQLEVLGLQLNNMSSWRSELDAQMRDMQKEMAYLREDNVTLKSRVTELEAKNDQVRIRLRYCVVSLTCGGGFSPCAVTFQNVAKFKAELCRVSLSLSEVLELCIKHGIKTA